MVHCILCGTGNDTMAQYCRGQGCGADLAGLREGEPTRAVQVECETADVVARAGDLVEVQLSVRNAGSVPDKYVLELRRDIGDRITVEPHGAPGEVQPGHLCLWTVRYAVPQDWDPAGHLVGVGGLFGVPGAAETLADAGRDDALEVPLRVVSTHDRQIAAGTTLTVRPVDGHVEDPERASRAARRQSRGTRFAAAGAVAAVAIVVALIVGMAAAGSGGGDKADPTKKGAATSTAPSGGATGTESGVPDNGIPTGIPTTDLPTGTSPSGTRSGKPPTSKSPTSAPATTVPNPAGTPPPGSEPPSTGPTPTTAPSTSPTTAVSPRQVPVPNFSNMSLADARAAAAKGEVSLTYSAPRGSLCEANANTLGCRVRSQSLEPGQLVAVSTPVRVMIDMDVPR